MFIEAHGQIGAYVLDYMGDDLEEAKTTIEENYHGIYESLEDYARELTEGCTDIPKHLRKLGIDCIGANYLGQYVAV